MMKTRGQKIQVKNFSLVELLVVVAILVVLFSLISPSLRMISSKAENVECAAKLRFAYAAYEMYLEDNAYTYVYFIGEYPSPPPGVDAYYRPTHFWRTHILPLYMGAEGAPAIGSPDFDNPNGAWGAKGGKMQQFLKSGVLSCSASDSFAEREVGKFYSWEMKYTGTFAKNSYLWGNKKRQNFMYPSKMFFMTDSGAGQFPSDPGQWSSAVQQGPHYATYSLLHESSLSREAFVIYRADRNLGYFYDGKANNMFIDGHIELMESYDLIFGYDGSPHFDYNSSGKVSHTGTHENGLGLGERAGRTVESEDFWTGGR